MKSKFRALLLVTLLLTTLFTSQALASGPSPSGAYSAGDIIWEQYVTISDTTLAITVGKTYTLSATIGSFVEADGGVTWWSSNTRVATVSSSGVVRGVRVGRARVVATVKMQDGSTAQSECCFVYVGRAVTGVRLNTTAQTVQAGRSFTLRATVSPSNAANKTVTWHSSNTDVATVSSRGVVRAVGGGRATITATTEDGRKTARCAITVPVPVRGVTLNHTERTVAAGKTFTLRATVSPSNATNRAVTWSSNNTRVASVSKTGVVRGVREGRATITATSVDGKKVARCTVYVGKSVTGVSLDTTTLTLQTGDTFALRATVAPRNAANRNVTWASSNEGVVSVSSAGELTAVGPGTATITVTTRDGQRVATCEVTVQ